MIILMHNIICNWLSVCWSLKYVCVCVCVCVCSVHVLPAVERNCVDLPVQNCELLVCLYRVS